MNEMEYLGFKEKLRGILVKIVIGLAIGAVFGIVMNYSCKGELGVLYVIFMSIMCAGIPYAWSVLPFRLGGIIGILITGIICMFLGWVITPIALIYNIIQMKRYEKKISNQ